jgi:hypothetical protein
MESRKRPYSLTIDADGANAIGFSGGRYQWSNILYPYGEGTHHFTEVEAWEIAGALDADDGVLPLLDPRSKLYAELERFRAAVV